LTELRIKSVRIKRTHQKMPLWQLKNFVQQQEWQRQHLFCVVPNRK